MRRATAISSMNETNGLIATVTGWVRERPITGLGIAFGIGYLLGGGLFSRTTGRLLTLGARLGIGALARNMISEAAHGHPRAAQS